MRHQVLMWAAGVGIMAGAAHAQNALGDGTALDNNLRVGSGGRNAPVRTLDAHLRFQNAIVTGNAPGGLSFRGDVGYRAPGEFTGTIAGDLNFRFRRDALFSGVAGQGIRGTEALQFQFDLLSGSNNTTNLGGNLLVTRPHTGAYVGETAQGQGTAYVPSRGAVPQAETAPLRQLEIDDADYDPRGGMLWNVRSPSTIISEDPLRPTVLDLRTDEQGNVYRLSASTLGGITMTPAEPEPGLVNQRSPESGAMDLEVQIPGVEPVLQVPETGVQTPADQLHTTYEDILERYDTAMPALPDEEPAEEPAEEAEGEGAQTAVQSWRARMLELRQSLQPLRPGAMPGMDDEEQPDEESALAPDQSMVDLLMHGVDEIDALAPLGVTGVGGIDGYSVNMQLGEERLAAGQYFSAEERFARALAARPGDPMAAVGRMHAQLGAGMYLSATLNLRALFANHPEIIGVTYDESIMPAPERLTAVRADLQSRLGEGGGLPAESALVLAYLGYQTSDRQLVAQALDRVDAHAEETADDRLARLAGLLRAVWIGTSGADEPTADEQAQ